MYIIFAIISFVFLGLEFKKSSALKLTFASSFMFSAIVAYKLPENYLFQIMSFFAFFGVFYLLIKKNLDREEKEKQKLRNFKEKFKNGFSNKENLFATVTKDIGKTLSIDGLGMVEFDNELWSAKSIDDKEIKAGNKVEIVSRENMILNVKVVK